MMPETSEDLEELKKKVTDAGRRAKKKDSMPSVFEQDLPQEMEETPQAPIQKPLHGREPEDWWWASEELLSKITNISNSEREHVEMDYMMSLLRVIGVVKLPSEVTNFDEAVTYTVGKMREAIRAEEHAQAKNNVLRELLKTLGTK